MPIRIEENIEEALEQAFSKALEHDFIEEGHSLGKPQARLAKIG